MNPGARGNSDGRYTKREGFPPLPVDSMNLKSVHPALCMPHRRYPGSRLGPGSLAAHRRFHLVLLHSCPDTVHGFLLRKTQTSTLLTGGSPARTYPRRDITPAGADCRYRAPLSPRLHGSFLTVSLAFLMPVKYNPVPPFCQEHCTGF